MKPMEAFLGLAAFKMLTGGSQRPAVMYPQVQPVMALPMNYHRPYYPAASPPMFRQPVFYQPSAPVVVLPVHHAEGLTKTFGAMAVIGLATAVIKGIGNMLGKLFGNDDEKPVATAPHAVERIDMGSLSAGDSAQELRSRPLPIPQIHRPD